MSDLWIGGAEFKGDSQSTSNLLMYRLAEQFYTNTWASHEFIPNVIHTLDGSGAGTPLADLVYSLALSRVLVAVRNNLVRAGCTSDFNLLGKSIPVTDVSFVDDMAQPVVAKRSQDLLPKIAVVTSIVCNNS